MKIKYNDNINEKTLKLGNVKLEHNIKNIDGNWIHTTRRKITSLVEVLNGLFGRRWWWWWWWSIDRCHHHLENIHMTKFQMLKKITVTVASHLAKGCVAMITRHFKVLAYLNTVLIEHRRPCEVE